MNYLVYRSFSELHNFEKQLVKVAFAMKSTYHVYSERFKMYLERVRGVNISFIRLTINCLFLCICYPISCLVKTGSIAPKPLTFFIVAYIAHICSTYEKRISKDVLFLHILNITL